MASARRLYRLYALLALAATGATVGALAAVVRATSFRPESVTVLLEACRRSLLPHLGAAHVLVLIGGALGLAVFARGTRSAILHVRAARRTVRSLDLVGPATGPGETAIVVDRRPRAFCTGLLRPRVYISTGALDVLADDELHAVLAHEAHHVARRDPLRMLVARVVGDALFFLPAMRRLRTRYEALAELAADEAAVRRLDDPRALAAAMLTFGEQPSGAVVGFSPERVDHLLGARPSWELPLSMVLLAVLTVAAIAAAAFVVLSSTEAGQVNAMALLVQSCFIIILAVIVTVGARMLATLRVPAAA